MAYNLYEAAKSFRNPLVAALFKQIVTEDELFSIIPFAPTEGNAYMFTREKALPTAEWVAPGGNTVESTGKDEQVSVPIREIASDFDIPGFSIAQQGGNAVIGKQMMLKGKAVGREIARALIRGGYVTGYALGSTADPFAAVDAVTPGPWLDSDRFGPGELRYTHVGTLWEFRAPGDRDFGPAVAAAADGTFTLRSDNPSKYIRVTLDVGDATADGRTSIEFTSTTNEPDGIESMIDPGQITAAVNTDGDPFAIDMLDQLLDAVKVRDNLAFFMPSQLRRKYKAKLRALGGTAPVDVKSFDRMGRPTMRKVLAYEDVPILKNDNILTNETVGATSTCSSIYLASLGAGDDGLHIRAFGGASTEANVDPIARSVLGFQFVRVGHLEGKNMERWRSLFYGAFCYGSILAMARRSGVHTV